MAYAIFAYVIEALFNLKIKDVIPPGRRGKPYWFAGATILTLIVLAIA